MFDQLPIQSRLLLTMRGISHSHALLASFGLHCRNVEDEIRIFNARPRLFGAFDHAILPELITGSTHVQVLFGHLHLAAHGEFAIVFAIGVRIIRLEEDLILLAFSAEANPIFRPANAQRFAPIIYGLW